MITCLYEFNGYKNVATERKIFAGLRQFLEPDNKSFYILAPIL